MKYHLSILKLGSQIRLEIRIRINSLLKKKKTNINMLCESFCIFMQVDKVLSLSLVICVNIFIALRNLLFYRRKRMKMFYRF